MLAYLYAGAYAGVHNSTAVARFVQLTVFLDVSCKYDTVPGSKQFVRSHLDVVAQGLITAPPAAAAALRRKSNTGVRVAHARVIAPWVQGWIWSQVTARSGSTQNGNFHGSQY